jgi:hypothetical protein
MNTAIDESREPMRRPRFTIAQWMGWTAVLAVNASLVRAFVVQEMFYGAILIFMALQVGRWCLLRSRGQARRFWLGFDVAGVLVVLALFWCDGSPQANQLLNSYVEIHANLAFSHLPDSLVDLIDEHWGLFLAVVVFPPELVVALLGGAITTIVARAGQRPLPAGLEEEPTAFAASSVDDSDRDSDSESRYFSLTRTRNHVMTKVVRKLIFPVLASMLVSNALADDRWVVYQGGEGPGKRKNVVLISGDEEYRSEEALPQLGKILAKHHGFNCTVLFAIGKDGAIDPNTSDNIPGLEALRTADLMVIATRFRDLPDDQMKEIVDYVESGRPIIGMRTATHAFNVKDSKRKYARYSFNSKKWDGGFGRQVLGETVAKAHED